MREQDKGRSCCCKSWLGFLENTAHHLTRYFDKLTGYYFVTQLALFLAAQPLLDSETIVSVLKLIPEPSQGSPRGKEAEEDADVGRKENFELERREIIEEFLEFSRRFPRQFKEDMVNSYLGWKEDL